MAALICERAWYSNGNKNGSLQGKIFLDDCLDKFDVLLLVNDGEVSLADVPQSENLSG